jgi:mannose-1-phosphate guanylyltransferase
MRKFNVYLAGAQENYFTTFEKSILHAHNYEITEDSFFELTINRNKNIASETIIVSDLENYLTSREILDKCGLKEYKEIIEPEVNCFTRAIAYTCFTVDPEDILIIHSPNDYFLTEKRISYEKTIHEGIEMAENGELVIIGTADDLSFSKYPYNYVLNDKDFHAMFFQSPHKPIERSALKNTGIYCVQSEKFLEALLRIDPQMYHSCKKAVRKQEGAFLNEILCQEIPQKHLEFSFFNQLSSKAVLETSFTCSEYIRFESEPKQFSNKKKEKIAI